MKQTVEEASCTHWSESTYKEDAKLAYDKHECTAITVLARHITLQAFKAGADWQAKQSSWISIDEGLPGKDGYYVVTDGNIIAIVYFFKCWDKFARYRSYPFTFYENNAIKAYIPIPSFDEILEVNKDVSQRIKEKGD